MLRFGLPFDSCQGDAKRLRQCLVAGYWRNGARWGPDGSYISVRGDKVGFIWKLFSAYGYKEMLKQVLHIHPNSVMFNRKPKSGWVVFHEIEETKKTQ